MVELHRTRRGWTETAPAVCPNGHPYMPGRMLVGWHPCGCGGHRTWNCRVCDATHYQPAVGDECSEPGRSAPDGGIR